MRAFAKLTLLIGLFLGTHVVSLAQEKVDMMALQGKYEGEEKKGLAHGKGKAVGRDTYIGEFKNGFPHGKGTYIWGEDPLLDRYEGTFKNGKKDGQGKLIKRDGTVKEGVWMDDEFAYCVFFQKGEGITRIVLKRGTGDVNTIIFAPSSVRETHNKVDGNYEDGMFRNVEYPFKRELEVENKAGKWIKFSIIIEKAGTWGVSVVL